MNTLFFQVPTLEFRHNAGTREYYLRGSECNKIMVMGDPFVVSVSLIKIQLFCR